MLGFDCRCFVLVLWNPFSLLIHSKMNRSASFQGSSAPPPIAFQTWEAWIWTELYLLIRLSNFHRQILREAALDSFLFFLLFPMENPFVCKELLSYCYISGSVLGPVTGRLAWVESVCWLSALVMNWRKLKGEHFYQWLCRNSVTHSSDTVFSFCPCENSGVWEIVKSCVL